MNRQHANMPKWPAYLMGAFALGCAYPAFTAPAPMPQAFPIAPASTKPIAIADGAVTVTVAPQTETKLASLP
jgi:hypothetical protein